MSYKKGTMQAQNVLEYGADPTGVVDCTAIVNGISLNQQPVYFPAGTYLYGNPPPTVSATLTAGTALGGNGFTLTLATGTVSAFTYPWLPAVSPTYPGMLRVTVGTGVTRLVLYTGTSGTTQFTGCTGGLTTDTTTGPVTLVTPLLIGSNTRFFGDDYEATTLLSQNGSTSSIWTQNFGIYNATDIGVSIEHLTLNQPRLSPNAPSFVATYTTANFTNGGNYPATGQSLPVAAVIQNTTAPGWAFPSAGYIWVADKIVQYTGLQTGSFPAFTGCTAPSGSLPTLTAPFHHQVTPFGAPGGHGVCSQANQTFIQRFNTHSAVGSSLYFQGPGTGIGAVTGQQIHDVRESTSGRCHLEVGPSASDGECVLFVSNSPVLASVLTQSSDWSFNEFHAVSAGMAPTAIIASDQVEFCNGIVDTTVVTPFILDATNQYTILGHVQDPIIDNVRFTNPGNSLMGVLGSPAVATPVVGGIGFAPFCVVKGRNAGATNAILGGVLGNISTKEGYSYVVQNSPQTQVLGGSQSVTTSLGNLNVINPMDFDQYGGTFTLAATTVTFTGRRLFFDTTTGGTQTLATGAGTLVCAAVSGAFPVGSDGSAWPSSGTVLINGCVELTYTSIGTSGGNVTLGYTNGAGQVIANNSLVTMGQFTGCTVASSTLNPSDLALITSPTASGGYGAATVNGTVVRASGVVTTSGQKLLLQSGDVIGGPTIEIGYAVSGALAVASGPTNFLPPLPIYLPSTQAMQLVGVLMFTRSAGSGSANITINHIVGGVATAVPGLSSLTASATTENTFVAATNPVTMANLDQLAPVVNSISGAPDGLSLIFVFTISSP